MGDPNKLAGFLLEVETAWTISQLDPSAVVRTEVREGTATSPCDVTVEWDGNRLDIQCKAMQSVQNEHAIEDLAQWLSQNFGPPDSVGYFDLQVTSSANLADIANYKAWQEANRRLLTAPVVIHYPQGTKYPLIRVEVYQPPLPEAPLEDFQLRTLYCPVDQIGMGATEDINRLRNRLIGRFRDARRTFGFPPGNHQANLVACSLPSLAMTDERSLVDALYGEVAMSYDPHSRSTQYGRESNHGLFSSGKFEYVSGMVVCGACSCGDDPTPLCLLPNLRYLETAKWLISLPYFRFPTNREGIELVREAAHGRSFEILT